MMLSFLRPLYRDFGRWASVYLDTGRRPGAGEGRGTREIEAMQALAAAGADAATLQALADQLDGPQAAAPGRAMFARDGRVILAPALRAAPRPPRSEFGPVPDVMPFLAQFVPHMPRVQVSAGPDGGAVLGVAPTAERPPERAVVPGQARREGGEDSARELAGQVQQTAGKIGAAYVLLAGDVTARGLLLRHLQPPLADNVVVVDAEIAADSPELTQAAEGAVAERVARQDAERFGEWQRLHARGRGVAGLPAVLAALRDGMAAEVFLSRQLRQDDVHVWAGPGPADVGMSRAELAGRGVAEPVGAHADAAIIRAIAGTDAELRFLPEAAAQPADRICATLR